MPAPRVKPADQNSESPWIAVDTEFAEQHTDLYRGIRLMVLAVLNLFGGHRPTHSDDPLGGAARPFKVERLNAISKRRPTIRAFDRIAADPKQFPHAAAA